VHTRIQIDNFRSIRSTNFTIAPGLNVLVGSNGSGKTNLLHALKFLSNLVVDGAAVAMGRAGGPTRNFMRGQRTIRFKVISHYETTRYKAKQTDFWLQWEIELSLTDPDKIVQICRESFSVFSGLDLDKVITLEVNRTPSGATKAKFHLADQADLTRRMIDAPNWVPSSGVNKEGLFRLAKEKFNETVKEIKQFPQDASLIQQFADVHGNVRKVLREIASIDEFNIQPSIARQATDPLPVTRMGSDGSSVSEVIHALETQQFRRLFGSPGYLGFAGYPYEGPSFDYAMLRAFSKLSPLQGIVDNLKAGVSSIDNITTEIDPSTGRRFIVFNSSGNKFRPEEISDGTIKWLCLLVALYVPRSRVLLLEEPENFMHPWMQQRFVNLAREQALKSGTTVVFSTHSATVLNSLEVDELLIVHQIDGATVVDAVDDKDGVQGLLDSSDFGLGDVWVSGGIGGVTGGV
jgi:energy-coupling factor transporter ATP-binding protein EcfA2